MDEPRQKIKKEDVTARLLVELFEEALKGEKEGEYKVVVNNFLKHARTIANCNQGDLKTFLELEALSQGLYGNVSLFSLIEKKLYEVIAGDWSRCNIGAVMRCYPHASNKTDGLGRDTFLSIKRVYEGKFVDLSNTDAVCPEISDDLLRKLKAEYCIKDITDIESFERSAVSFLTFLMCNSRNGFLVDVIQNICLFMVGQYLPVDLAQSRPKINRMLNLLSDSRNNLQNDSQILNVKKLIQQTEELKDVEVEVRFNQNGDMEVSFKTNVLEKQQLIQTMKDYIPGVEKSDNTLFIPYGKIQDFRNYLGMLKPDQFIGFTSRIAREVLKKLPDGSKEAPCVKLSMNNHLPTLSITFDTHPNGHEEYCRNLKRKEAGIQHEIVGLLNITSYLKGLLKSSYSEDACLFYVRGFYSLAENKLVVSEALLSELARLEKLYKAEKDKKYGDEGFFGGSEMKDNHINSLKIEYLRTLQSVLGMLPDNRQELHEKANNSELMKWGNLCGHSADDLLKQYPIINSRTYSPK